MIVARQKKKENIAEYLLYMWQIEDIIRACGGNIDVIQKQIIDGYRGQSPETMNAIREWYENLCEMMRLDVFQDTPLYRRVEGAFGKCRGRRTRNLFQRSLRCSYVTIAEKGDLARDREGHTPDFAIPCTSFRKIQAGQGR